MEQIPGFAPLTESGAVKILLVDDQSAKLLTYEAVLTGIGATLIKASSACEAFECLLKNEVALILVDVCMPDIDGFELASLIRDHPRFQQITIIFISAEMHADLHKLRGYELGAVDYISVPIVPELLRAKVKVFVDLYQKTRRLKQLNADLEREVSDRTTDLRRRNEDLAKRIEERTREHEAYLAQFYDARQANVAREATEVVHDFNNLLMAVLGSLSLLARRLPKDQEGHRLLDNASQAVRRGSALTRTLLAFSRRREGIPASVSIGKAVNGMQDLLRHALGLDIKLILRFPRALPTAFIETDQLQLALLNLALAARTGMPGGGRLLIGAAKTSEKHRCESLPRAPTDYVGVKLCAVPASVGEVRQPPTNIFTETGLGVSVARDVATRAGGHLALPDVTSAVSTAELWVPRMPRAATPIRRGDWSDGPGLGVQ